MPHQRSDISRQITQFGKGLSSFSCRLENDIVELKRAVSSKPHTEPAQMQHCLQDMLHRATACGQDIIALECMTVDAVSLEEICGHCFQLFQENQARINDLENYLQQYGYQPQARFSIPSNPLEPMESADCQQTSTAVHSDSDLNTAGPATDQAQAASCRQPFRHVTNLPGGASPPSRQHPMLSTTKAFQAAEQQRLSVERITPTPSPVLSSSTDMPYSPSMRELQQKYGAASFGSYSTGHRDSIESVSMPPQEQPAAPAVLSKQTHTPPGEVPGLATQRLPVSLDEHQQRFAQSTIPWSDSEMAPAPTNKHLQDPAKLDVQTLASTVAGMQLVNAVDEETTLCLREQLIHSRCTESSTPDWYALTPVTQPVHMPTAAPLAGSCCTPQHHPPAARPETPDTAKLLQRALASNSGSALVNSLSQEHSHSDPMRSGPSSVEKLKEGRTVAAAAASSAAVQDSVSGRPQALRSEQQQGQAGSAAVPSSSSRPALVSNDLPNATLGSLRLAADGVASAALAAASALPQGFQIDPVVTSRPPQGFQTAPVAALGLPQGFPTGPVAAPELLLNQQRLSQQNVHQPMVSDQPATQSASHGPQPAEADQQKQQQQVDLFSASAGQQFGANKAAKHGDQLRKGLETGEGQFTAPEQAAAYQQPSLGLNQAAGHHAGLLQQEGPGLTAVGLPASIAESAGHVTSQEYMSLGTMQRRYFSLEQINSAVDFMRTLTCTGSSFSTEDLRSLQLAEMKTKMLVASLAKLGKLRVNLHQGQITGYFMQSAGD